MISSLAGSADTVNSFSLFASYSAYAGIGVSLLLVVIGGGSMEMVWALINTLQLISYLPLMTPYFPEHVRIMFEILQFTNCDFEFLTQFIYSVTNLGNVESDAYNETFEKNGVDTPLFLQNCASLLFSLILSLAMLGTCVVLYYII